MIAIMYVFNRLGQTVRDAGDRFFNNMVKECPPEMDIEACHGILVDQIHRRLFIKPTLIETALRDLKEDHHPLLKDIESFDLRHGIFSRGFADEAAHAVSKHVKTWSGEQIEAIERSAALRASKFEPRFV